MEQNQNTDEIKITNDFILLYPSQQNYTSHLLHTRMGLRKASA